MENQILLFLLFLAIVVMAGYYYWKRAQRRSVTPSEPHADRSDTH